MRSYFLFFIFCLCALWGSSQQKLLDSLEAELGKHLQEDTTRLSLLGNISFYYYEMDPEKGLQYSDEELLLAKKLNNEKEQALAYSNKGINYWAQGEYSQALANYKLAGVLYEKLRLNKEFANLNNRIATVYFSLSDYSTALDTYFKNLTIFEKLNDSLRCAVTYGNIALCYSNLTKYNKAIEYYEKAIKINEGINNKKAIADNYTNLGNLYDNIDKPDLAISYYQKALNISIPIGYNRNIASNESNIGIAYTSQKDFIRGYEYLMKALPFYAQSGNKKNVAVIHESLAEIFLSADPSFFTKQNIKISDRYIYSKRYLDSSMAVFEEIEDPEGQSQVWEKRSAMFSQQNNFKEALSAYQHYKKLQDSVMNDEKNQTIANLEMEYAFTKREDSIKAENEQMALAASSEIKRQSTLKQTTIIISSILLSAAVASFIFYKRKRDAVEKQQEAEFKTEVTDTEMKALRAQMNPHFIFNSLNSISDYISKNNIPDADKYLSKFAKLMRLILENSEQKEIALQDDLKALELYMQLEALRMKNKFTHSINVDEVIDVSTVLVPPLILQPFVENSIWHGIAGKDGSGHINIRIKKEGNEMINCIVEDDGIGRKRAAVTDAAPNEKTSLGMKITQERIDVLNKIKNTKAGVQLFDLEQGLRVEVKLPFVTT
ncbi:MAG: tetratricopeptide repeat protein [Ferruginibacter sp.]